MHYLCTSNNLDDFFQRFYEFPSKFMHSKVNDKKTRPSITFCLLYPRLQHHIYLHPTYIQRLPYFHRIDPCKVSVVDKQEFLSIFLCIWNLNKSPHIFYLRKYGKYQPVITVVYLFSIVSKPEMIALSDGVNLNKFVCMLGSNV